MGVPGFVAWLRKRFKNKMILSEIPSRVNILYFDGNCLFHPQCYKIYEKYSNVCLDPLELENLMFNQIGEYIERIVKYVKPEICYFAVDGVAPFAKITRQRRGRYCSIYTEQIKQKLQLKYEKPINKNKWSNVVITPGTEFMERLDNYLKKLFATWKIKVIYSSFYESGEGEHKILKHIKSVQYETRVIYG